MYSLAIQQGVKVLFQGLEIKRQPAKYLPMQASWSHFLPQDSQCLCERNISKEFSFNINELKEIPWFLGFQNSKIFKADE
jgi:hypothetical protein